MKRLYWSAPAVPRRAAVLLALLALASVTAVERLPRVQPARDGPQKLAAAQLAQRALGQIRIEKQARGIPLDPALDPARSGVIGPGTSAVTSNVGYLSAKRTSVNPNFAAVLVELLGRLDLERGSLAAVGVSGSFPALNIATFAALHELGLPAIVVSSAAASQWGATDPELTWLDMEQVLVRSGLWTLRSSAASRGGVEDQGYGMSAEGLRLIDAAIARSGALRLAAPSLEAAIDERMEFYDRAASGRRIRVYINVGGGTVSVGTHVGKRQLPPGLNTALPAPRDTLRDSVMVRFLERGVPVIHLSGIADLARRHGLPEQPTVAVRAGQGGVFSERRYDWRLAALGLLVIVGTMLGVTRSKLGSRWFGQGRAAEQPPADDLP